VTFSAIEKILESATGLDSNSIGSNVVQRVVKTRMEIAGEVDVDGYYNKLQHDKNELQALIEDVTVPETWFFRDRDPFSLLSEIVRAEWMPPSKERMLRILSVPCATGEEAYSIAMIMHDLGFDSNSLRIDAVDISKRALARASEAVYRENSFRGDEGNYLHRFFDKDNKAYRLRDIIRRMVKFSHGNLLDDKFLAGAESYDVIFCRNVMIYFTRDLQAKAVKKLHRLLAVGGLLFVGHAEAANLSGEYFSSVKRSGTFAFRKKIPGISKVTKDSDVALKKVVNDGMSSARTPSHDQFASKSKKSRRSIKKAIMKGVEKPAYVDQDKNIVADAVLKKIRGMADEGRLDEASTLCEKYLESETSNADAYYLLGLIRGAEARDAEASNLFRKAVYLNPGHYNALIQLSVLAESQGNLAAAAVYRARASRLTKEE
jgi:chemotaxis protein methyltransferase WspC